MWAGDAVQCFLSPGEVLVARSNTPELVGRAAMFAGLPEQIVASDLTIRTRPKAELMPPFLASYLSFLHVTGYWKARAGGASGSMKKITRAQVEAEEIPVPPLGEQRRIVGQLGQEMAAVGRARAGAAAQLESVRLLPARLLHEAFGGSGAEAWPRVQLGEACEIQLGKMLSPASKTGTRSQPYLRNANVLWNQFDLSSVLEMDFSEDQADKLALRPGDLLVCEGGEPGRSAVWNGEISPCYYQKALHRLRARDSRTSPHFLMFRLWFGSVTGEFLDSHSKTTIAHLPAIRLGRLAVGVPRVSEQLRIVRSLNERMAGVERLRKSAEDQLAAINALPAALLRRAFSGAL
ncbi:MAG: hypothetical protein AABZ70_19855 [candidate division NC10 bacterium]